MIKYELTVCGSIMDVQDLGGGVRCVYRLYAKDRQLYVGYTLEQQQALV